MPQATRILGFMVGWPTFGCSAKIHPLAPTGNAELLNLMQRRTILVLRTIIKKTALQSQILSIGLELCGEASATVLEQEPTSSLVFVDGQIHNLIGNAMNGFVRSKARFVF